MARQKFPTTRMGWFNYYTHRFGKTLSEQAEHLACWYWLLILEHET